MTTADQAPESDSSMLRNLFKRFSKDNMAQGGRVGSKTGHQTLDGIKSYLHLKIQILLKC